MGVMVVRPESSPTPQKEPNLLRLPLLFFSFSFPPFRSPQRNRWANLQVVDICEKARFRCADFAKLPAKSREDSRKNESRSGSSLLFAAEKAPSGIADESSAAKQKHGFKEHDR